MYKIIHKENGYIEISMTGHLTEFEIEDIISDIKSAKQEHNEVNILLDFTTMTGYDKVFFNKNDSIDSLENGIERIAAVSSGVTALPFMKYMKNIAKKYREFNEKNIDEARKWAFEEKNNQAK
jgi:hypothetical protein